MKNRKVFLKIHTATAIGLLCLVVIIYSCHDPVQSQLTETERVAKLLQGTGTPWAIQSVKVDDVVLDLYTNFNVSFKADGKYTTVNGGLLWPASGTWTFKDDAAKSIVREDGLEIAITDIMDNSLIISFTRTGDTVFEGGRSEAVGGKHVITLGR